MAQFSEWNLQFSVDQHKDTRLGWRFGLDGYLRKQPGAAVPAPVFGRQPAPDTGHQQILCSGGLILIFAFASIEFSELRIQETLYCQLENRHAAQACGTAFRLIARGSDC